MIGLADKGGATAPMPGMQPKWSDRFASDPSAFPGGPSMGQANGLSSTLANMFINNPGYQQTPLQPSITAPQYPSFGTMSPDQAAAATRARMLARMPPVAPAPAAPSRRQGQGFISRHSGDVYA